MVEFLKQNIAHQFPIAFASGVTDPAYFALQADLDTVVNMSKNDEEVLTEGTNDVNDAAGDPLTEIDNAVNWSELETGVDDFIKGDNKGLTGIRITPAGSPGSSAITGTITQYKQRIETAKQ